MDKQLESGSAEIVEFPHLCAVFDKSYISRYARGANGLFHLIEMVRLEDGGAGAPRRSVGEPVSVPWEEVSLDSENGRCPWCGVRGWPALCPSCSHYVCQGRTTVKDGRTYFRCRESCGGRGFIGGPIEGAQGWNKESGSLR